jgi:hypothetical protein
VGLGLRHGDTGVTEAFGTAQGIESLGHWLRTLPSRADLAFEGGRPGAP